MYAENISGGNIVLPNIAIGNISVYDTTISSNPGYGNLILTSPTNIVAVNTTGALQLPIGTTLEQPVVAPGGIRFNSDTGTLEYYTGMQWTPITGTISRESIAPDGTTATYTLNQASTADSMIVNINGVLQQPYDPVAGIGAYTMSGKDITFAEPPLTTDIVDIRFMSAGFINTIVLGGNVIVNMSNVSVSTSSIIDTWSIASYRSAKYIISGEDNSSSNLLELLVTQFNNAFSFNSIDAGGGLTLIPSVAINNSNVEVSISTTYPSQIKFTATYFEI